MIGPVSNEKEEMSAEWNLGGEYPVKAPSRVLATIAQLRRHSASTAKICICDLVSPMRFVGLCLFVSRHDARVAQHTLWL